MQSYVSLPPHMVFEIDFIYRVSFQCRSSTLSLFLMIHVMLELEMVHVTQRKNALN